MSGPDEDRCWNGFCMENKTTDYCPPLTACPYLTKRLNLLLLSFTIIILLTYIKNRCPDGQCISYEEKCEKDVVCPVICDNGSCPPCFPFFGCPTSTPYMVFITN